MADQLTATLQLQVTQGIFADQPTLPQLVATLAGQGLASGIQVIGNSAAENVTYDDVDPAEVGLALLWNLDQTNYVDFGLNDGGTLKAIGRLLAKEWAFFRLKPGAQLMAQANGAPVRVLKRIYQR